MPRLPLGSLLAMVGFLVPVSVAHAGWFSDETPPANAKPLSAVIKSLEDRGYKIIEHVDFDDDRWEIEAHRADGTEVELHVNAVTGRITKEE